MALDFTLLTAEQIWGRPKSFLDIINKLVLRVDTTKKGLQVLQDCRPTVAPTDLAILLGAWRSDVLWGNGEPLCLAQDGELSCAAWTCSEYQKECCIVLPAGTSSSRPGEYHYLSVRPVLSPSETARLIPTGHHRDNGIDIAEYGVYPQMVADLQTSQDLENAFEKGTLQKTGKEYTFNDASSTDFKPDPHPEYEYKGKKYVRVKVNLFNDINRLSDGRIAKNGQFYWVEVQPIEWYVDPTGTWISRRSLLAGIPFDTKQEYDGDFSKTFMKHYLDTYFAKEIETSELIAEREKRKQQAAVESRKKILTDLSARLEKAIDANAVETIKKRLIAAERGKKVQTTPKRLHEASRIKRLRNARDILLEAAREAYAAKDMELLKEIVKLEGPYSARYAAQQDKIARRRVARRAKRVQGGRG